MFQNTSVTGKRKVRVRPGDRIRILRGGNWEVGVIAEVQENANGKPRHVLVKTTRVTPCLYGRRTRSNVGFVFVPFQDPTWEKAEYVSKEMRKAANRQRKKAELKAIRNPSPPSSHPLDVEAEKQSLEQKERQRLQRHREQLERIRQRRMQRQTNDPTLRIPEDRPSVYDVDEEAMRAKIKTEALRKRQKYLEKRQRRLGKQQHATRLNPSLFEFHEDFGEPVKISIIDGDNDGGAAQPDQSTIEPNRTVVGEYGFMVEAADNEVECSETASSVSATFSGASVLAVVICER